MNLVCINSIIKEEIDENDYIQSLVNILLKYKVINNEQYEQIGLKFLNLLSFTIKKYTGELTSSVPISKAKNINTSNLYIIGLFLKGFSLDVATKLLLDEDIFVLYEQGISEIDKLINKTKLFYSTIFLNNLVSNDNYFYNSTLKDGITGFFKVYNRSYDAHNIFINVDYEPFLPRPRLQGIEFISRYLEMINYENVFCNRFDTKKILEKISPNYRELPINIFEIVLTFIIVSEYLNQDIDNFDIERLYNDFELNEELYIENLNNSYNCLKEKLSLNEYIDSSSKIVIKKIVNSTRNKSLDVLFGFKRSKIIEYYPNPKMSNDSYTELINLLKNSDEKIRIINNVDSLFDLIDIFNDIDFSSEELTEIFSNLKLIEIIALNNYYIDDSFIRRELNRYIMTLNEYEQKIVRNIELKFNL